MKICGNGGPQLKWVTKRDASVVASGPGSCGAGWSHKVVFVKRPPKTVTRIRGLSRNQGQYMGQVTSLPVQNRQQQRQGKESGLLRYLRRSHSDCPRSTEATLRQAQETPPSPSPSRFSLKRLKHSVLDGLGVSKISSNATSLASSSRSASASPLRMRPEAFRAPDVTQPVTIIEPEDQRSDRFYSFDLPSNPYSPQSSGPERVIEEQNHRPRTQSPEMGHHAGSIADFTNASSPSYSFSQSLGSQTERSDSRSSESLPLLAETERDQDTQIEQEAPRIEPSHQAASTASSVLGRVLAVAAFRTALSLFDQSERTNSSEALDMPRASPEFREFLDTLRTGNYARVVGSASSHLSLRNSAEEEPSSSSNASDPVSHHFRMFRFPTSNNNRVPVMIVGMWSVEGEQSASFPPSENVEPLFDRQSQDLIHDPYMNSLIDYALGLQHRSPLSTGLLHESFYNSDQEINHERRAENLGSDGRPVHLSDQVASDSSSAIELHDEDEDEDEDEEEWLLPSGSGTAEHSRYHSNRLLNRSGSFNTRAQQSSWIIYAVGGIYPSSHVIFSLPETPSYEQLLELGLLDMVKPSTVSQRDLNLVGRLEKLSESSPPVLAHEKCTVCLSKYRKGENCRTLNCLHMFHTSCVDEWLTRSHNSCPICRAKAV